MGSTAILMDAHLVTDDLENFQWLENVCTPAQILEK
jgi:hypothetical protein